MIISQLFFKLSQKPIDKVGIKWYNDENKGFTR